MTCFPRVDGRNVSQDKLKCELQLFLRELSTVRPIVLFFDDLHWVEASTIDLLSHVASQIDSMQLLGLITYRMSDMMVGKHPSCRFD
jgi:predicted ATPase